MLLIDELDRADEPFEAFLLELLADFQITVPEFGTVRSATRPVVILTSNRTREVHDAIRRRCLYHWVDTRMRAVSGRSWPPRHRVCQPIWRSRSWLRPAASQRGVVQAARRGRDDRLGASADYLNKTELTAGDVDDTLGVLLKYQDDIAKVRGAEAARLVTEIAAAV